MTGASAYPFSGVRFPRVPLRLNCLPGATKVPLSVRAAILMLLVRVGLSGKYVVKVEMTSLGLIFSASAVVSWG